MYEGNRPSISSLLMYVTPSEGHWRSSETSKWEKAWQLHQLEVDGMILDFMRQPELSYEKVLQQLLRRLRSFFVNLERDPAGRSDVLAFVEGEGFRKRVEARVRELVEQGLIRTASEARYRA
jgi:hypothetical protein